jgi:hypothetical protein
MDSRYRASAKFAKYVWIIECVCADGEYAATLSDCGFYTVHISLHKKERRLTGVLLRINE